MGRHRSSQIDTENFGPQGTGQRLDFQRAHLATSS